MPNPPGASPQNTSAVAWRDGQRLIVRPGASLPQACIKCGKPTAGRVLRKTFYWSPSNVFRFIPFPGSLIALVIDMMRREKMVVEIPICTAHRRIRMIGQLLTWLFCSAGVGAIAIGLNNVLSATISDADNASEAIVIGICLLLAGGICFVCAARLLKPKEIEEDRAVFTGAGAQFLRLLPTSPNLKP